MIRGIKIYQKFIKMGLIVLLICTITGCESEVAEYKKELDIANEKVAELTKQLEDAKRENKKLSIKVANFEYAKKLKEKQETVQENDVEIVVTDKINKPKDINSGIYYDYCKLSFEITNNTDKDIQGIEGMLEISDIFGKNILTVSCDFLGKTIKPHEQIVNDTLGYDINEFNTEDRKLYDTDFRDLKFAYKVKTIVFTDGTNKKISY